jgi:hypothetical protein
MIADYPEVSKAEKDRLVGTTLIPSYGKLPVHNKKFNQLIQYLEKLNKQLQVPNPTKKQIGLQDTINTQLNLERLKILADEYEKSDKSESTFQKILAQLAFRNWCGAGTNIYENIRQDLDNPSKMFAIDTICRDHDIRYTKAKTKEDLAKADDIMMEEIMKKYVLNFDKNFITGNYNRDFSTWSSSFNSLYNQVVSLLEASFATRLIYETSITVLNTAIEGVKLPFRLANFLHENYRNAYPNLPPNIPRSIRASVVGMNADFAQQSFNTVANTASRIIKQGTKLAVSSVFKDKVYASIAFLMIGFKKSIEEFFDVSIVSPVEHEVTDEQLNEIIRVFEILQNEYLTDSDIQPIKVGDQWQNELIEIPPVEELEKELAEIFVMNKEYVEKRYEIAEIMDETIDDYIDSISKSLNEEPTIDDTIDSILKNLEEEQTIDDYINMIEQQLLTINEEEENILQEENII